MMQLNRPKVVRTLARRYQRVEEGGFRDLFLAVVIGAGGLATGGVVLLAFVQARAMLALVFVLAVTATMAVAATIAAMLRVEDTSSGITLEKVARERQRRALRTSGERSARRQTSSREALLPR